MKNTLRIVALLLVPLVALSENPPAQAPGAGQNSILNLYDAFGYQKRGTILDWAFPRWCVTTGKPFFLIPATTPIISSTT